MSHKLNSAIAVIGIDIGKNSFHVVGHDKRGAIMLRQKWSRGQVEARLANLPPCLIGMEACVGAHHLSRKLQMLGLDDPTTAKRRITPAANSLRTPPSRTRASARSRPLSIHEKRAIGRADVQAPRAVGFASLGE
jgi:hypothetical protein